MAASGAERNGAPVLAVGEASDLTLDASRSFRSSNGVGMASPAASANPQLPLGVEAAVAVESCVSCPSRSSGRESAARLANNASTADSSGGVDDSGETSAPRAEEGHPA